MSDPKEPLRAVLSDDKTLAKIRTTMLPLNAKGVEDAIGALAEARSRMQPAIPQDLPADYTTHRHQASHYDVAWDFLAETPSLSFRSPAFGWLTFLIPNDQIDTLCQALKSARDKSLHSDARGLDGKYVQTEQYQDHAGNRQAVPEDEALSGDTNRSGLSSPSMGSSGEESGLKRQQQDS